MSDKLDRFTKRARRVLTLAQEEALRLNHNYIGTEHLLLGLVREENGVAVKVLRELGVEPVQIIRAVERTVGRGERPPFGKPTLAPRTKRVIELAVDEARLMGHHYIGTEHLLLGLIREKAGLASQVLTKFRVSEADIKFEQFWSIGSDHDSGIDDTAEIEQVFLHASQERVENLLVDDFPQRSIDDWSRGIGPHAAGIGAESTIFGALVVLSLIPI